MNTPLLGRTNRAFPPIWLSLSVPHGGFTEEFSSTDLVSAAVETGSPIDVTSQPALWGGALRQIKSEDSTLMMIGGQTMERASDEKHAMDLTQAHLIETLSSVGRESIDFYFLRVRRAVEEQQINGALEALELAKQEGHIKHLGIYAEGPGLSVLGMWQFHDAFETLLVARNHYDSQKFDQLAPLAKERRVGVVTCQPLNWGFGIPFVALPELWRLRNLTQSFYGLSIAQAVLSDLSKSHPVLVGVRSPHEVQEAVDAASKSVPDGFESLLAEYRNAFDDEATWENLATHDEPWIRRAARARMESLANA